MKVWRRFSHWPQLQNVNIHTVLCMVNHLGVSRCRSTAREGFRGALLQGRCFHTKAYQGQHTLLLYKGDTQAKVHRQMNARNLLKFTGFTLGAKISQLSKTVDTKKKIPATILLVTPCNRACVKRGLGWENQRKLGFGSIYFAPLLSPEINPCRVRGWFHL